MKTIKEVLENQEQFSKELYSLLMQGKSEEALQIISDLGYQIRTENRAPLDEKEEFDNEAHELAIFLQTIIDKVERNADISQYEVAQVVNSAKRAVKQITNVVMRTAEVRRSLSDYDRELYRKNLRDGIEEAQEELNKTQKEYDKMLEIKEEIFGEPSILLSDEISEEEKFRQIRDNLEKTVKKYSAFRPFTRLLDKDFSTMDPTTEEGRKEIEAAYRPFQRVFSDLERRRLNAENNIENFNLELETLDKEDKVLAKDTTDSNSYKENMDDDAKAIIEAKKEAAHIDNIDKFYGNERKAELYKEKFLKFKSHIKDAELSYKDREGNIKVVKGKTIEDYEGMGEDLEFLQLESYKERLERISMYRATKDYYAYNPELAKKIDMAETEEEKQAIENEINEQLRLDIDYLATYHGAQNITKMKYENYMSAGSALKSMLPVKSVDTIGGKIKNSLINIGKYTGLKIPRFSRKDENGKRVSDVKSGLVALGGDAIILGSAALFPAATGIAYAAKTIGVLSMRGYGRIFKRRHKDDMNIPTPYSTKSGERRAAREKKYMEEGHSRIGSWARAVIDNVRPKHREEIENQIIEDRNIEIDKSIENQYILGAMARDEKEKIKVKQNERTRQSVHQRVKESEEVYNDVYREPGMAEGKRKDVVDRRISEAISLGVEGEDISDPDRISFTDSRDPRSTNFGKGKLSVLEKVRRAIEDDTVYGDRIGETVWTSSIENEDAAKSITRKTDMKRRIVTVLAGLGIRGLGKLIDDQVTRQVETQQGTGEYEKVKVGSHKEREIIGYNTKKINKELELDDVTLGDLERKGRASYASFNSGSYYGSEYHPDVDFLPGDDTIQGLSFKFKNPATGEYMSYSISSKDIGNICHNDPKLNEFTQIYSDGYLGLKPSTKLADVKKFITDPKVAKAFDGYLGQYTGTEQIDKMLDAVEFAWGRSESMIGRGWAPSELMDRTRKVISEVVDYNNPIYGDWKEVSDYELREITKTILTTKKITDPTLHAIKGALEQAGLATSLQQLGEATAETAQPVDQKDESGLPYVKLDKAEDIARVQQKRKPYVYKPRSREDEER